MKAQVITASRKLKFVYFKLSQLILSFDNLISKLGKVVFISSIFLGPINAKEGKG
ncbi:uncharacterized protein METZ01_LOCUS304795 [marine metagenome]|uniref:Uncharacterized protein n=1 Tax=marine metagenome TaxID=408172 RepID=A0A382MX72_9ZZZZ